MPDSPQTIAAIARQVLDAAREAGAAGEVPVAAAVCRPVGDGYQVLALESNQIIAERDPTAHAELRALRAACKAADSERLPDGILITALEPCMMCTGALVLARIETIYYFAPTEKGAGMGELLEATAGTHLRMNHYPRFELLSEFRPEYTELLRGFFKERRGKDSA